MRCLALFLLLPACAAPLHERARSSSIHVVDSAPCAPLAWPVDANVSSPFGRREGRAHDGIDLGVPEGTAVHAACAGVVRYASDRLRGYGRLVILEHAAGLTTVYAHNHTLLVSAGATVARGQVISRSGATGHVTAPHVHFEVRRAGKPVDPLGLLAPRPLREGIGYALGPATHAEVSTP